MRKAIRLVVLIPLAGALLCLSFLSLAWSAKSAAGAQSAAPRFVHPTNQMRLAMARVRSDQDLDDPAILGQVRSASRLAPLAEEPFILKGLALFGAGDYKNAEDVLDIARMRNPRSREALYLSADAALAAGNVSDAVDHLEVLARLAPRQRALTQETITLLATHPETGRAALAALSDDGMKTEALIALARSGAGTAQLLDAITLTGATNALASNPGRVNAITQPLVDASDFVGAYRVWSALLPNPPSSQALIRDQDFSAGLPPPFGWEVRSGPDAFVEAEEKGLVGEIYGRKSAQLARQLLLLAPGAYQLDIDATEPNSLVEVIVMCAPNPEVARAKVATEGSNLVSFRVPDDCKSQWLEVRARASDPPRAGTFHIRSIRIRQAGA